jgi:hypothetical protein
VTHLYTTSRHPVTTATAVERLSDHIRLRSLPWPARRLVRRFGIGAATAAVIAEMIYMPESRR